MAYVFQTFDKNGKAHKRWRYRYVDRYAQRRVATGTTTKRATEDLAAEIELREKKIRMRLIPPPKAAAEIRAYSKTTAEYIESGKLNGGRRGFGWSKEHARHRRLHLAFWGKRLSLRNIQDIDLVRTERALQDLKAKGNKNKTLANKVEALKAFCLWCTERGYLESDPLAGLRPFDTTPEVPHRAFTPEELAAFLAVVPPARSIVYRVALATGYRMSELRALRVRDLDRFGPSLPLAGEFTKNRKDARQPISQELAGDLESLTVDRLGEEPLLSMPRNHTAHENFVRDLEAAGLAGKRETAEGKLTFHSLRVNYVNGLVTSGADLKTVMELARHSSAFMSMQRYAKPNMSRLREAAEAAERASLSTIGAQRTGIAVAGGALSPEAEGSCNWRPQGDLNPRCRDENPVS